MKIITKKAINVMLRTSKLISFLDQENNFQVRFLEGQKLINDLALMHDVKNHGFEFFRNLILTNVHLISTLKQGEGFGLFIDSNDPYFRFKLECSENGNIRTLLFPEDINILPENINGELRFSKLFPGRVSPYTSIISLDNESTKTITNIFLKESHQLKAQIFLTELSDQSIYIAKLPKRNERSDDLSVAKYWESKKVFFEDLFKIGTTDSAEIITAFKKQKLTHLQNKEIKFSCPCSQQKMIEGIWSLIKTESIDQVFLDKEELDIRCDYCKTNYVIHKNHFKN
jgi:molecular chaperone Hsp33